MLKDVKYETEIVLNDYLGHLEDRFDDMIKAIAKIQGKKELVSFLRKAFEADEQEFANKGKELKKDQTKIEGGYRKEDKVIVMLRNELIIGCISGGFMILVVWGVSFACLYQFMKQSRSVTLVPRGVRFSELKESPKPQPKLPTQTPPKPILRRNEPTYFELGPIETAV